MPAFYSYLLVGIGSALGGMARHWTTEAAASKWGLSFPWGTLAVNVIGSLLIGALAAGLVPGARWTLPMPARELLMVGVLGGYTTFSSFSLQTFLMLEQGEWLKAGGNVVLSVVSCLGAVAIGYLLAASVLRSG